MGVGGLRFSIYDRTKLPRLSGSREVAILGLCGHVRYLSLEDIIDNKYTHSLIDTVTSLSSVTAYHIYALAPYVHYCQELDDIASHLPLSRSDLVATNVHLVFPPPMYPQMTLVLFGHLRDDLAPLTASFHRLEIRFIQHYTRRCLSEPAFALDRARVSPERWKSERSAGCIYSRRAQQLPYTASFSPSFYDCADSVIQAWPFPSVP
jgi:hypothetical protein